MKTIPEWVSSLDYMRIFYGVAIASIVAIIGFWSGVVRKVYRWVLKRKAYGRYVQKLREECNLLIVIGKRQGFKLMDVYVDLDIAVSDLNPEKNVCLTESESPIEKSYVLLGGPGAGKSTTIKRKLIEVLDNKKDFPILLKLRDYVGHDKFEKFIEHKLKTAGFPDEEECVRKVLNGDMCQCVLDGLDEVRPELRDKVISDINAFYHKYFVNNRNVLIVTCRKEAYRKIPLDIPTVMEVRPLNDEQIRRFAKGWPLGYPPEKSEITFWRDLGATERILELARSPLLLVGGLMQYTESNLGIPEQRFGYLKRVSEWLIEDWAKAQGHPADPLRLAYARILAKLAFCMQSQKSSEISRTEAEKIIERILPTLGITNIRASEVLDSITARTGILVTEEKNNIVFSQFGLQEYFASLDVVDELGVEGVALLEPKDWWRETILLAAAQQREPTQLLESLFQKAPLIGAAAVAECPTPSVDVQQKAYKVCLEYVDRQEKGVSGALIPLLRKVNSQIELELCLQLEERLARRDEGASIVGLCLATAGTDAATKTLAKHPELWGICLKEANYLSSSVEHLLVDWIKKGTDEQSDKAADLIALRMSSDRLVQLLDVMRDLPAKRAEKLAVLILEHCTRTLNLPSYAEPEIPLQIVARCVPFISSPKKYLEKLVEKNLYAAKEASQGSAMRQIRHVEKIRSGITSTCLYLENKKGERLLESEIRVKVNNAMRWAALRGAFLLFFLAPQFILSDYAHTKASLFAYVVLLVAICWAAAYPNSKLPWGRRYCGPADASMLVNIGLVLLSGICVVLVLRYDTGISQYLVQCGVSILAMSLAFYVRSENTPWWLRIRYKVLGFSRNPQKSRLFKLWYAKAYLAAIFVGTVIPLIVPESYLFVKWFLQGASIAFSLWTLICLMIMRYSYLECKVAAAKVESDIEKFKVRARV